MTCFVNPSIRACYRVPQDGGLALGPPSPRYRFGPVGILLPRARESTAPKPTGGAACLMIRLPPCRHIPGSALIGSAIGLLADPYCRSTIDVELADKSLTIGFLLVIYIVDVV